MADHRMPGFGQRARRSDYAGRHRAGDAGQLVDQAVTVSPLPEHAAGLQVGDPGRVPLELHFAGDVDRSDGIWRV